MKTRISDGNSKLGKIPNVSLLPVRDCAPNIPCWADCYALKAVRCYATTRNAWTRNSRNARKNPGEYFAALRSYLSRKAPRFFRWHVAGDILSQKYYAEMVATAREFPNTIFLAFTKRHDLDYSDRPSNLTIIASMWPAWGDVDAVRAAGLPIAWMQNGRETRIPERALECPGKCDACGMCWQLPKLGLDVVFSKH